MLSYLRPEKLSSTGAVTALEKDQVLVLMPLEPANGLLSSFHLE